MAQSLYFCLNGTSFSRVQDLNQKRTVTEYTNIVERISICFVTAADFTQLFRNYIDNIATISETKKHPKLKSL